MADPFFLDLLFTRTTGTLGGVHPGNLVHFVSLSLRSLSAFEASGVAFDHGGDTLKIRRLAPAESQGRRLLKSAMNASLHQREPHVQPCIDTANFWSANFLRIFINDRWRTVDLSLTASGYDGADSAALKVFFAVLLELSGIRDESVWHDLTDGPYNPQPPP